MYLDGYVPIWLHCEIMNAVLHALADESRRTMLEILRSHPASAGELAAAVPIARPGVSRHLRVLREAGLVEVEQQAQRRIYRLRPEPLAELDSWLEPLPSRCGSNASTPCTRRLPAASGRGGTA